MQPPEVDKLLGMEVYSTRSDGIGGVIKESVDDFIVEELLVDGSKASPYDNFPKRVIGSSLRTQRFLLCILTKRNWDTLIATKNIAKSLDVPLAKIQYAGIKDARALTSQFITIEEKSMEEVTKLNLKDIKITPIGYLREGLTLFYLLGNNFTITIKHPTIAELEGKKQLEKIIQQVTTIGGLPNFFGHQRFGTTRPITHLVGKALYQGHVEEAAMLFLAKPSPLEHPESRQAREHLLETHDFQRASDNFPKQLRFERQMLIHLASNPADFVGAFRRLPQRLQALFIQAQQSYLYNKFLSARIKRGLPLDKATPGDFVVAVERTGLPLTEVSKIVTPETLASTNNSLTAGKLRVALPLFGVRQKLSGGEMGEIENEILQTEGIDKGLNCINDLSRVNGRGGLRTVLTPLKNFNLLETSKDSIKLSFTLLRGCYATVLLREFIKPKDSVAAGF